MPRSSTVVEKTIFTFIWSFKKGDNLVYNFRVLDQLYAARAAAPSSNKYLFNKPIIVNIVAIIECIFADFLDRVKEHRREAVPNLTASQVTAIRYKGDGTLVERQIKELTHFIDQLKKHDLLDAPSGRLYTALHYYRQVRNRIHIQNAAKTDLPEDEAAVFNDRNLRASEQLLELVLRKMVAKFPRPQQIDNIETIDMNAFPYPWHMG